MDGDALSVNADEPSSGGWWHYIAKSFAPSVKYSQLVDTADTVDGTQGQKLTSPSLQQQDCLVQNLAEALLDSMQLPEVLKRELGGGRNSLSHMPMVSSSLATVSHCIKSICGRWQSSMLLLQ